MLYLANRNLTFPLTLTMFVTLGGPAFAVDPLSSYELEIVRKANTLGAPLLDLPMAVLSNREIVVLAPAGAALIADKTDYYTPMFILGAESFAYAGAYTLKVLTNRLRPYQVDPTLRTPLDRDESRSFPSGHAAISFAAATVFADAHPEYALPAYTYATLVSYSRMYGGLHYPSDLLAGAVLGYGTGKLFTWGKKRFESLLGKPPVYPFLSLATPERIEFGVSGSF